MGDSGDRENLLIDLGQKEGGIHMHPTWRAEFFLLLVMPVPPFPLLSLFNSNFIKVMHVNMV